MDSYPITIISFSLVPEKEEAKGSAHCAGPLGADTSSPLSQARSDRTRMCIDHCGHFAEGPVMLFL